MVDISLTEQSVGAYSSKVEKDGAFNKTNIKQIKIVRFKHSIVLRQH
jgi:hypothetical protein